MRKVVENMKSKLDKSDLKFFVQKFMPQGRELIISAKKEETRKRRIDKAVKLLRESKKPWELQQ